MKTPNSVSSEPGAGHGRYFFENDIPSAVVKGTYVNPRLHDNDARDAYFASGKNLLRVYQQWDKFWSGYEPAMAGDPSYYKSTLIIPLTFWNNELSDEFKKAVGVDKFERSILGYLCFDHREVNFFEEPIDVTIGMIFADILSVYIFNRLVYTDISNTYRAVTGDLKQHNKEVATERMEDTLNKLGFRASSLYKLPSLRSLDVETKRNRLVAADPNLLDYVGAK